MQNMSATYLLLGQIIGQVSHHDLGLGSDAIGRGATFTALASGASLLGLSIRVSVVGLVGNILQWLNLVGCGIGSIRSGALSAILLLILYGPVSLACMCSKDSPVRASAAAYLTSTASTTAPGAGTAATATGGLAAAGALTLSVGVSLLGVGFGLASELDRDLALKNLLARELGDGTLGLGGGGQVDKGVADRALGSRVLGDGDSLAADVKVSKTHCSRRQYRL